MQAATVAQALVLAAEAHPGLRALLLDDAGALRAYYSAFVGDVDMRSLGGMAAHLGADDVLTIVPPIAGGGGAGPGAQASSPEEPSAEWLRDARAHAEHAYPEEACGLVLRTPEGKLEARPARNLAPDPRRHFDIAPEALLDALERGALHGFYHSHPDGSASPSAQDLELLELWGSEVEWTVISVESGRAGAARSYSLRNAIS